MSRCNKCDMPINGTMMDRCFCEPAVGKSSMAKYMPTCGADYDDDRRDMAPIYTMPPVVKNIDPLWAHLVVNETNIRFEYLSPSRGATTRSVKLLGCYKSFGNTYIIGYCMLRDAKRTFRVDRIQKVVAVDA
jgi:predicted DNA-binding transcriptional regulator YafY